MKQPRLGMAVILILLAISWLDGPTKPVDGTSGFLQSKFEWVLPKRDSERLQSRPTTADRRPQLENSSRWRRTAGFRDMFQIWPANRVRFAIEAPDLNSAEPLRSLKVIQDSIFDLREEDPARFSRAYKPKIISTARGFGR